MKKKHWTMIVPGAVLLSASPAFGVELRDAVQQALSTNPEIRLMTIRRKPSASNQRRGRIKSQISGKMVRSFWIDAPLDFRSGSTCLIRLAARKERFIFLLPVNINAP